jgi:hypothetical protein
LWKRDDAIAGSRPSSDVSKRGLELETPLAASSVVTVSHSSSRFCGARPPIWASQGPLGLACRFRMFHRPFHSSDTEMPGLCFASLRTLPPCAHLVEKRLLNLSDASRLAHPHRREPLRTKYRTNDSPKSNPGNRTGDPGVTGCDRLRPTQLEASSLFTSTWFCKGKMHLLVPSAVAVLHTPPRIHTNHFPSQLP